MPDGHRGFVVRGSIEYEFEDADERLVAHEREAFLLPAGRAHRGRNVSREATCLFLIDDPP